jgi:hypothetical protein
MIEADGTELVDDDRRIGQVRACQHARLAAARKPVSTEIASGLGGSAGAGRCMTKSIQPNECTLGNPDKR